MKKPIFQSLKEFHIEEKNSQLGSGSFAQVKKAIHKSTQQQYAIKIVEIHSDENFQEKFDMIKREIIVHQKLDHPNIIKLYDYFYQKNQVYLILEYAEIGNLFHFMRKNKLKEKQKKQIFQSVCSAVKYLHDKDIIHRDIKPENILLNKKLEAKICDFGWSVGSRGLRETFCGTFEYMAPEIITHQKYSKAVDIWCLGILLYELYHNKSPFKSSKQESIFNNILMKKIVFSEINSCAKNLIQTILKTNPHERPSIDEILSHKYLSIENGGDLEKTNKKKQKINHSLNSINIKQLNSRQMSKSRSRLKTLENFNLKPQEKTILKSQKNFYKNFLAEPQENSNKNNLRNNYISRRNFSLTPKTCTFKNSQNKKFLWKTKIVEKKRNLSERSKDKNKKTKLTPNLFLREFRDYNRQRFKAQLKEFNSPYYMIQLICVQEFIKYQNNSWESVHLKNIKSLIIFKNKNLMKVRPCFSPK